MMLIVSYCSIVCVQPLINDSLTQTSFTLTVLIGLVRSQQLPSLSPYQTAPQLATATTPKPYYPPAQVHYVNIGEDLAGDYKVSIEQ